MFAHFSVEDYKYCQIASYQMFLKHMYVYEWNTWFDCLVS